MLFSVNLSLFITYLIAFLSSKFFSAFCLPFCSISQNVLTRFLQICFKVDKHKFSLSLKINYGKETGLDFLTDALFCFIDDILLMTDQQDFELLEIPV